MLPSATYIVMTLSLPVRGAWVEIMRANYAEIILQSLPVRGAWVEILYISASRDSSLRRSPCGERGLKCFIQLNRNSYDLSLPVRGAWVEITAIDE